MRVGGGSGAALVLLALVAGCVGACSPVTRTPKPSHAAPFTAAATPSPSVPGKDVATATPANPAGAVRPSPTSTSFSIKDALDRTVKFARLPMRIVIAGDPTPELADTVYMFPEASARVVARQSGAAGADFVTQIDPGFGNKRLLENNVDPLTIAKLKPHVAILRASAQEDLGRELQGRGIPVVYLSLATPDAYMRDIAILGAIFGNAQRATALAAYFNDQIGRIRQAMGTSATMANVLLLYYSMDGPHESLRVPPLGWMQSVEVGLAGAAPAWKDARLGAAWTEVSFDQLENWQPKQIYLVGLEPKAGNVVRQILLSPTWQKLDAVRQGYVFAFPRDFSGWDGNDPRWLLGLTWLAVHVHPELSATFDLPSEVRTFYTNLYSLDNAQFDRIVRPMLPAEFH